jgi:kumamolisin
MSERKHVPLKHSKLPVLAKSRRVRDADPSEPVRFTLHLRHREPPPYETMYEPAARACRHLSPEEFEEKHGADAQAIDAVRRLADAHKLSVGAIHAAAAMVELHGTVEACEAAFGIDLYHRQDKTGTFRGYDGHVQVPEELHGQVEGVVGLDTRCRLTKLSPHALAVGDAEPAPGPALQQSYFPTEVAELYDFPKGLDGSGETIAIVEFGGGYYRSDIDEYFRLQNIPVPSIVCEPPGTGLLSSAPEAASLAADVETATDIQIAGTIAPGARFLVYFARPGEHYLDAYNRVVFDPANRPTVVSISYANAEGRISEQEMRLFDRAVANAALMGITTCVASGDAGSATGDYGYFPPPPAAHVNFPANCPHVLSCGGTTLQATGGRRSRETAWNDLNQVVASTGGGISTFFPRPEYQAALHLPANANGSDFSGRGVPDVAGNASAYTGYKIMFAGRMIPSVGGTSCVAPLWAALIARLNQGLGQRCGFINPWLYRLAGGDAFRPITEGGNGAYRAGPGWNACTGLGAPNGTALLRALEAMLGTKMAASSDQQAALGDLDAYVQFAAWAAASAHASAAWAAAIVRAGQ